MNQGIDEEAFGAFEPAGWEERASTYLSEGMLRIARSRHPDIEARLGAEAVAWRR